MKRFILGVLCVGVMSVAAFAQSNRATRPRVAVTPTPAPPAIQNDTQDNSGRRPPTLSGDPRQAEQTVPAETTIAGDDENEVIKVETNLVTMPVSVVDRSGRFIAGLSQKDFQIFENGVQQKVGYFQSVEQPFTVVLMIDVSPSTAFRIDEIHDAAISFVNQLRPDDRVMVVAFDDSYRVLSPPTNNRSQLRNAIYQAQFGDGTSLYEAVDRVINRELRNIDGRKAVVLFTDGVDTTSRRANYQSTIADVEEVDALFYPVRYNTQRGGFGGGGVWGGGRRGGGGGIDDILGAILGGGTIQMGRRGPAGTNSSEYETGRRYLETLAANSGGRNFEADTTYNLETAFAGIAEELRRQYSLGYYPDKPGANGERRQIRVRVMRPDVIVKAKSTYVFGGSHSFAGR